VQPIKTKVAIAPVNIARAAPDFVANIVTP
jgi:hypothetical protein